MVRAAALICILVLAAGCVSSEPRPDGAKPGSADDRPPSSTRVLVEAGSWVLVEADVGPGDGFAIHVDHNYTYVGPTVRPRPDVECASVIVDDGWVPLETTAFHRAAGFIAGQRTGDADAFALSRYAKAISSSGGVASVGLATDDRNDSRLLAGHAAEGLDMESLMALESSAGLRPLETGRYWCLVGPWDFPSGDFRATPASLQAEEIAWTMDMEHGMFVRMQVRNMEGSFSANLEDGEEQRTQPFSGATSQTFCSSSPGAWSITGHDLVSSGTWSLSIEIFDIASDWGACQSHWQPTTPI